MKIDLVCTANGFVVASDEDYDKKRKLKIGKVYSVDIKQHRNYELHKKYFALINCAWEYLSEGKQSHFGNVDNFRKTIEVIAGYFDEWYSPKLKQPVHIPKSISYASMDNLEFEQLYSNVWDVLFRTALSNINEEEFAKNLVHFMPISF